MQLTEKNNKKNIQYQQHTRKQDTDVELFWLWITCHSLRNDSRIKVKAKKKNQRPNYQTGAKHNFRFRHQNISGFSVSKRWLWI